MLRSIRRYALPALMALPLPAAENLIAGASEWDGRGNPTGWDVEGAWLLELGKAEGGGISMRLKRTPAAFNEASLKSKPLPLQKGVYRASCLLRGDAGTRLFLGMRAGGAAGADLPRSDRWVTLDGNEKKLTVDFTLAEDGTARLLLCVGVAENEGKTLAVVGLALERRDAAASLEEKRIGAGAEYDGILIPRESETRETNRLAARVAVDESRIVRAVSPLLFGYNHDGPSDNAVLFKDNRIDDSVVDRCRGIPMPLNRIQAFGYYPATRWKQCLGPFESREAVKMNEWEAPAKKAYGPVEALAFCLRVDPSARFTWNIHVKSDAPEDSADLVEFLTGDGAKPRGATNWARFRIEGGVLRPVAVAIYEMGNEVDWANPPKRMAVGDYIERSRRHLRAIRSVDPGAKIALHAATAPWAYEQRFKEDWRDWHRTILRELGDSIDYLSFHPYYSGLPISMIEGYLDTIRDDIRSVTGSDRIKVFISEHATWPKDIAKRDTWYEVLTLSAALSVTHFLSRLLARPEIEAATFHGFTHGGGLWGLIDVGKETKVRYPTVFADLFKLLGRGMGEQVLATAVSGDKIPEATDGEKTRFAATAMSTPGGMQLLLVNREPAAPRAIDFSFRGRYALVHEAVLTAPSLRSHNTEFITNAFVTERALPGEGLASYLMPPKSVVVLTLRKK